MKMESRMCKMTSIAVGNVVFCSSLEIVLVRALSGEAGAVVIGRQRGAGAGRADGGRQPLVGRRCSAAGRVAPRGLPHLVRPQPPGAGLHALAAGLAGLAARPLGRPPTLVSALQNRFQPLRPQTNDQWEYLMSKIPKTAVKSTRQF